MEFETSLRMKLYRSSDGNKDCVAIKPCNPKDYDLFEKLEQTGKEVFIATFRTPVRTRTYKQHRTVFKLVECIWYSQNADPPTREEKEQLYEDLKAEYADKRISTINPDERVPIGLTDGTVETTAHFIQQLINILAEDCDIKNVEQWTTVRQAIQEWEEWRGTLKEDPLDYEMSDEEYRELHKVSEASGEGGQLHKHHIVTRGSDARDIDEVWNWIMITVKEHADIHQYGEEAFLKRFPHLKGKFARAHELANKIAGLNK